MSLTSTKGEDRPRKLPSAGTHVARCISIIDLGTQETPFGEAPKVRFTWELPEERAVFRDEDGAQPFVVSKEYTNSLFERANLRKDLDSWRGGFTEQELGGFRLTSMLGKCCLVVVTHKETKAGKTFANVGAISALPKGMQCPDQVNESVAYDLDDGNNTIYNSLPQWLRERIDASVERSGHATREKEHENDDTF